MKYTSISAYVTVSLNSSTQCNKLAFISVVTHGFVVKSFDGAHTTIQITISAERKFLHYKHTLQSRTFAFFLKIKVSRAYVNFP